MLRLLRQHRDFRLLVAAKTASAAGDTVLLLALPYFLYVSTGSVASAAGVFIVAAIPNALLGPWLGTLADRVEPRRLLIGCDVVSGVTAASLFAVAGGENHWLIYVAAFVLVCCGQTVNFTRGAVTPRLVPAEDLLAANALESAILSLVRVAAPPIGGLLFAVVGLSWLIVFNALTFALSAACVWAARLPQPVAPARGSVAHPGTWDRARELLHPAGRSGRLIWITGAYFLVSQASGILLIPFVRTHFEGDAVTVGMLSAAGAAGALVGAVLSLRAEARFGALPALAAMLVLEGAARLVVTVMPTWPSALVAVMIAGGAATAFLALLQTTLQQCVEPDYVGRLLGLTWSIAGFATIAGMVLFTGRATYQDPVRVLQESAVMGVLLGLLSWVVLRRGALVGVRQEERDLRL